MVGGNGHNSPLIFTKPVTRAVSLVPSITQSLIDLECADALLGVTEFCPRPDDEPWAKIVGGTHAVDLDLIIGLKPELVLANQEENDRADVEALEEAGIKVWVTFPRDVQAAIDVLWAMARVFGVMKTAAPKILLIERSLEWVLRGTKNAETKSVFVPIWQEEHPEIGMYWMTFNRDTYCDSVLRICGARNVFEDRLRRYPLAAEFNPELREEAQERDQRYPRVSPEEVVAASPQLILLPSEPFMFLEHHRNEIVEWLSDTPAVQQGKVFDLDGRWLGWHGTMLAHALASLPGMLD